MGQLVQSGHKLSVDLSSVSDEPRWKYNQITVLSLYGNNRRQ